MSGRIPKHAESEDVRRLPDHDTSILSLRSRRQFGFWATGGVFMLLSTLVTRRSIARRYQSIRPPFFHPSNEAPVVTFNGPLEAVEALSLASLNVFSFSILITGGMFWAFDISSVKEWRDRTRAKLGYEDSIAEEQSADGGKTPDEWIVAVLDKEDEDKGRRRGK
ncbi:hypothetical protein EJ08DRAFT_647736 [Tothia fuscella]|uniref:Altered inheritance of mitochondria protein 11 n=1 Tax=Tothia fuscella TaxID=1048955 RepID=A0A9P4NWG3_9PEZI|nr:hypothetical protein EJ08DRAFT_647736 [Tothia fuscella]